MSKCQHLRQWCLYESDGPSTCKDCGQVIQTRSEGLEAGFYWVQVGTDYRPIVMEWCPRHGERGLWYVCGVGIRFSPDEVKVFSGRLQPPIRFVYGAPSLGALI